MPVSCYKEAVQFSASFVVTKFCGTVMNFVFFFVQVSLIKTANTPHGSLAGELR